MLRICSVLGILAGMIHNGMPDAESFFGGHRPLTLQRLSSRTHRLDQSFLAELLQGVRRYWRIAGYFTSSLFEIAQEWLEPIPEVRIVCNVDLSAEDLKVAQLREMRLLGRWNERSIEAERHRCWSRAGGVVVICTAGPPTAQPGLGSTDQRE